MQATTDTMLRQRPVLMRLLVRSWNYRHPRIWIPVRVGFGIWNLSLASVLFGVGWYWEGAIPLVAAAELLWTAKQLQKATAV